PVLAMALTVAPDPVVVGETAAITVPLSNSATAPAEDVDVMLPAPDGALALPGPSTVSPTQGWHWQPGHLDGQSSVTLTATLRLVRMPSGEALLVHAQATALGLL